jgi:hypothetical protein
MLLAVLLPVGLAFQCASPLKSTYVLRAELMTSQAPHASPLASSPSPVKGDGVIAPLSSPFHVSEPAAEAPGAIEARLRRLEERVPSLRQGRLLSCCPGLLQHDPDASVDAALARLSEALRRPEADLIGLLAVRPELMDAGRAAVLLPLIREVVARAPAADLRGVGRGLGGVGGGGGGAGDTARAVLDALEEGLPGVDLGKLIAAAPSLLSQVGARDP